MTAGRCLLTGGSGFLGRYLAAGLRRAGFDVAGLGRHAPEGSSWIRADLTRPETLPPDAGAFDLAVHAAGLAHQVPHSEAAQRNFFAVNAGGTRHLLAWLARQPHPPRRFVLISSVAVYGREQGELLDEDTPPGARHPYGASKAEAEAAALQWAAECGVRTAILRLPLVWGENAPGNLAAMSAAIARRRYAGIRPGSARRSVVWARDVAEILPAAAEEGGVFHLTDGEHPAIRQFEAAFAARHRVPLPPALPYGLARLLACAANPVSRLTQGRFPLDSRRFRKLTSSLTFSDERARARLGWKPHAVIPLIEQPDPAAAGKTPE